MKLTLLSAKEILQQGFLSICIKFGLVPEEVNDYYKAIQVLGRTITGESNGCHVGHLDEMVLQLEAMYLKLEKDGVRLEETLLTAYGVLAFLKQYSPPEAAATHLITLKKCHDTLLAIGSHDEEETLPPK